MTRAITGKRSIVALVVLASVAFVVHRLTARPPRPHIVVIVWDTCRADRVSAMGYGIQTTPHLDAFADEGTRFTSCFSPSPWTPPAHASLFTGLVPARHGMSDGTGMHVHDGIPMLAETLAAAGYDTVGITSNANVSSLSGMNAGFHTFERAFEGTADIIGDNAVAALERWAESRDPSDERPAFVFVNLIEPHLPLVPPVEHVEAVRPVDVDAAMVDRAREVESEDALAHVLGIRRVSDEAIAGLNVLYDAAVRHCDALTHRIFQGLEKHGLMDNAVVVVTADHGENLGEGGALEHRFSVKDTVLHVPLVIRWPSRLDAGTTVTEQVRLQDVYATLLEAARVPIPRGNGTDSLTLTQQPISPRRVVASFGPATDTLPDVVNKFPGATREQMHKLFLEWSCVRDEGTWKYERVRLHGGSPIPQVKQESLYRVDLDPDEKENLMRRDVERARIAEMRRTLDGLPERTAR